MKYSYQLICKHARKKSNAHADVYTTCFLRSSRYTHIHLSSLLSGNRSNRCYCNFEKTYVVFHLCLKKKHLGMLQYICEILIYEKNKNWLSFLKKINLAFKKVIKTFLMPYESFLKKCQSPAHSIFHGLVVSLTGVLWSVVRAVWTTNCLGGVPHLFRE